MSGGRRIGCRRRKGSVSRDPWHVEGDALRKGNLLQATQMDFLSSLFEC